MLYESQQAIVIIIKYQLLLKCRNTPCREWNIYQVTLKHKQDCSYKTVAYFVKHCTLVLVKAIDWNASDASAW